ncbi:fibromodulin [Paramormyrops kingsleyae]|uniref:Zgc:113307 n=1 Tax=Paramormyrops kingsleyae TaxID=1676925 RepID=A0A3B3RL60_9TELE|nr:lumican-like [Paramormyrops kingsleyae]
MDVKPILLVLLMIRPAQATTADYDYGGIPLRINRLRGDPSVLSLWGRIEPGWFRSVNPQVCPAECDCPIQWPSAIYCDQRGRHQLPASLPPRTQYLFLQRNNISDIGANAFSNSTHLRWLLLDHNQLVNDQVAHSAFSKLSYLEILFMNHNNLTEIPTGLPDGLRQLRLAHNQIQKISPRAFQNLQNLTLLLLQGNQLKVIGDEDFTGLLSLNLLDLSQNHLEEFPKHLPPAVQQLYLSNNSLRSLGDESLHGFHSLRYLRLGYNRLHSSGLSAGAFNLSSLVELDLSYNQLTSTPTVPTTLQYLYLEVNLIHEFNVSSFCRADGTTDYSRLRILRMEGNRMAHHQLPPDWVMCLRVIHRIYI